MLTIGWGLVPSRLCAIRHKDTACDLQLLTNELLQLPSSSSAKVTVPMKAKLMNFLRDEEGLTTVEYAVAGALITVAVVAAFTALGGSVAGTISIIDAVLPG